jgi:hypothetical protein
VARLYPQALGTHFSRLLRHARATAGLFLFFGRYTEIICCYSTDYTGRAVLRRVRSWTARTLVIVVSSLTQGIVVCPRFFCIVLSCLAKGCPYPGSRSPAAHVYKAGNSVAGQGCCKRLKKMMLQYKVQNRPAQDLAQNRVSLMHSHSVALHEVYVPNYFLVLVCRFQSIVISFIRNLFVLFIIMIIFIKHSVSCTTCWYGPASVIQ